MRRHHPRGFAAQQRRKLVWADSDTGGTIGVGASGSNVDLLSGFHVIAGVVPGITIIRTHASINFECDSPTGNSGISVGFIVNPSDVTLPVQNTSELYLDWMLLTTRWAVGANGVFSGANAFNGFQVDLKAKRKCEELNQTYWMAISARDSVVTKYTAHVRTLVALP
jgi:hypothetical protein